MTFHYLKKTVLNMYLIARKEEPCFISKNRSTNIIRLTIICNQAYIVPSDYLNHYKPFFYVFGYILL